MRTKKAETITIRFERRRWTARYERAGKTILVFRTKQYVDLVAFVAINQPEAA